MRKGLLLCAAAALNAYAAGPLIFGTRGGVSALSNNATGGRFSTEIANVSPLLGPTVGVRFGHRFSVEGDALWNRQTVDSRTDTGVLTEHVNWWQFPIMAKYTVGEGLIAPVFGAGVSIRHIGGMRGNPAANTAGVVVGGGVRFKVGPFAITPEGRYTRWGKGPDVQPGEIPDNRNQGQVLLGFTF